ncbi:MAG: hypothetical protein AAB131_10340, partial [Actinomycetota bacterium]
SRPRAAGCSSGNAELIGNDLIVTLSADCNPANADPAVLMPKQLGSIMHETGHNLGLGHGGTILQPDGTFLIDNTGYKPNHLSVMNYAFQFPGVGTTVDATGRYVGGAYDFCRAQLVDLNENGGLDEPTGIIPGLWDLALMTRYVCPGATRATLTAAVGGQPINWGL